MAGCLARVEHHEAEAGYIFEIVGELHAVDLIFLAVRLDEEDRAVAGALVISAMSHEVEDVDLLSQTCLGLELVAQSLRRG